MLGTHRRLIGFIGVSLMLVIGPEAYSRETLLWVAEYKPNVANRILLDEELRGWLHKDLNWPIETVYANTQRAMRMVQEQDNVCVDDKLITSERQQFAHITDLPQVVVPGKRLYMRADSDYAAQLGAENSHVGFQSLMASFPELRLGVMAGRRYGNQLDEILQREKRQARIWRRASSYSSEELLQMLVKGRIDATIEYPMVVANWGENNGDLISFRLKEAKDYSLGYIMCSRSPSGEVIIGRVNQWLAEHTQSRRYLELHLKWMEASIHKDFIEDYNQVFNTEFKLSEP
ncbi:hypothetical protein HMF8227_02646 [Saliniradius amylolyticus]|uniref:Uncharacterized protein n=2 Tax=Saliniradius amylolyticus TaxID=2183582 RepID=A0A2S2E622_9ALTE|nr:hypothetical protein HMF8227_02646 [Saliniradius amylolyticus]